MEYPLTRLDDKVFSLKKASKKALVAYLVAGDPDLDSTLELMHEFVDAGVDILEVGVPFTDPIAEGPIIQAAHDRALKNNTSLNDIFKLVKKFKKTKPSKPIILMGYYQMIFNYGEKKFIQKCKVSGVDGPIVVDLSFPDSVVDMMRGNLGQPPGGFPKSIVGKILKGEKPNLERPGKHLKDVDLELVRTELSEKLDGLDIDDEDLNGYLMYPKVFLDYMERHQIYGPVRALPTKTFFYGMEPGEEITAEIDPGKTLEIRLQAVGETDEKGDVRVFFELNGQPRIIRVPNRLIKSQTASNPKAEVGNDAHVGAPMPGVIAGVTVSSGQAVNEGDLLLTIEAMKMETGLHAERDAIIKVVHVGIGSQIDAKDLLIEFE